VKRIFEFFAGRHVLATLLTVMILLLGINSLRTLQRDRFPNVDWGWVDISTVYPGASPEDVELNVTNRIEDALKSVSGIKEVDSLSVENASNVYVQLDPSVKDQEKVKANIRDAVGRVTDLPEEVSEAPLITESTSASETIVGVGIVGDRLPYGELREMARELEKKLKAVPGVASVDKLGYRVREIKVEVDPRAIERYQIPLREIIQAIESRNIRLTGGTFESFTSEKNVVTLAEFQDPREVGDVIVRSSFEGPAIRIKDLAVIKDDFEQERNIARVFGRQGIIFGVYKNEDADIIRTVAAIRRMIEEESDRLDGVHGEQQTAGPAGIWEAVRGFFENRRPANEYSYGPATVYISDDISQPVQNSFQIVVKNGLIGLALVLLVLTLFLNLRSAVWVAMGIPVSVLGACFLFPAFGSFLDTVTLTVLVIMIGLIVDDGIIISENIAQLREKGLPPLEAAARGVSEVFFPVLATALTTFMAFAPMFFMKGEIGKVVYVVPLTVGLTLFFSILESTLALPAHLAAGFKRSEGGARRFGARPWFRAVKSFYQKLLLRLLKLRYALVPLFVGVLLGALWYARNNIDFVLFPSKGAERFYLDLELPTGSSLEATKTKFQEVEALIAGLPQEELDSFFSRIGSTDWGSTENSGWVGVNLTPYSQRSRNADQIVEELRGEIEKIEGIERFVFYVDAGGPQVGKPVTLRVIGNDEDRRRALVSEIKAYMATIEGIKDIDSNDDLGKEQIEIKIDYERLARLGLTAADVARTVRVAFDGQVVTSIRGNDEDVGFRVQLAEGARKDLGFLENLAIPNREGRLIKLRAAARLETSPSSLGFRHFDGERVTTIEADVDQDIITSAQATARVMEHFDLDRQWPGLRWLAGGEAEETQKSVIDLIASFTIALLGVYFLLVLLFNSFTQPFMVLLAVPFGVVGVIIAFALHGEHASFLALLGVIGLTGVVVNDSLVLVNHLNNLRRRSSEAALPELVALGTAERLRPIILTTVTTVCGLLPLAYGLGGSDIYMSPMALTMGWGLLFATPATLVLIPCLYMIGWDLRRLLGKAAAGSEPA
jgi:multidrug efflux pump subunit AcrB